MRRRPLLLMLLVTGELVLVAVVLRFPNIGAARGFLVGSYPTAATTLAASVLLMWSGLLIGAVVLAFRSVPHVSVRTVSTRALVLVMVALGLAVLGVGAVRHLTASYAMCCGSISQARQQLANPQ